MRVLRAAVFRALKPRLFDPIFPLELVHLVREEYGFKEVPTQEQLVAGPANFTLGKLEDDQHSIIVEQLTVTYVGLQATSVAASTRSSTDEADFFLDHLTNLVADKYGLDKTQVFLPAYHSQIEFALEQAISSPFETFASIGHEIAAVLKRYGKNDCPEFEFAAFSMDFDRTKPQSMPVPTPFAVERRVGAAYEENKYFSQAPLKTGDHKAVLERLEKLLLE